MSRPSAAKAILTGGLAAGALDITAAILFWKVRAGIPPIRILQSVASGVLGKTSFEGGAGTAALGLGLHFSIATIWTAIAWLASRRLTFLTRDPWTFGALYGVFVWAAMQFVVLPLSAVNHRTFVPDEKALLMVAIHIVCVGWPIAWAVRHHGGRPPA